MSTSITRTDLEILGKALKNMAGCPLLWHTLAQENLRGKDTLIEARRIAVKDLILQLMNFLSLVETFNIDFKSPVEDRTEDLLTFMESQFEAGDDAMMCCLCDNGLQGENFWIEVNTRLRFMGIHPSELSCVNNLEFDQEGNIIRSPCDNPKRFIERVRSYLSLRKTISNSLEIDK